MTCEYCFKKFSNKFTFKRHVATMHDTTGKFTCVICKEAFPSSSALKSHGKTHEAELIKEEFTMQPIIGTIGDEVPVEDELSFETVGDDVPGNNNLQVEAEQDYEKKKTLPNFILL